MRDTSCPKHVEAHSCSLTRYKDYYREDPLGLWLSGPASRRLVPLFFCLSVRLALQPQRSLILQCALLLQNTAHSVPIRPCEPQHSTPCKLPQHSPFFSCAPASSQWPSSLVLNTTKPPPALRLVCAAHHRTAFPKLSSVTPSRPAQFQTHRLHRTALYLAERGVHSIRLVGSLNLPRFCRQHSSCPSRDPPQQRRRLH